MAIIHISDEAKAVLDKIIDNKNYNTFNQRLIITYDDAIKFFLDIARGGSYIEWSCD